MKNLITYDLDIERLYNLPQPTISKAAKGVFVTPATPAPILEVGSAEPTTALVNTSVTNSFNSDYLIVGAIILTVVLVGIYGYEQRQKEKQRQNKRQLHSFNSSTTPSFSNNFWR